MPLNNDIAFYRLMYRNEEMTADAAAQAVVDASNGGLAHTKALWWITASDEALHDRQQEYFDIVDAIRAVENGRQIPEAVDARLRERFRQSARAEALRMIRRCRNDDM